MSSWAAEEFRALRLEEIDMRHARYRLSVLEAEETMARQLVRLPAGNQQGALETGRRNSLSAAELRGVVDLLLVSGTREKAAFVLERPREALREAQAGEVRGWDPRLSSAGNRVSRPLAALLDQLARMGNWRRHHRRGDLALCDRGVLEPAFTRLAGEAQTLKVPLFADLTGRQGCDFVDRE